MDRADILILLALVTATPYLYLLLPATVFSVMIGVGLLSTLLLVLEPAVGLARWLIVSALLATDLLIVSIGTPSVARGANDVLAVLAIAAIANVWVQAGLRARDAALLAAALMIYDPVAAWGLGLTGHLFEHLGGAPFAPIISWPAPHRHAFVFGAGDVLVAALMPTVITKAYGLRAGLLTAAATITTLAATIALSASHAVSGVLPVMIGLGPVAIGSWLLCRQRWPHERTTHECREPHTSHPTTVRTRSNHDRTGGRNDFTHLAPDPASIGAVRDKCVPSVYHDDQSDLQTTRSCTTPDCHLR